MELEFGKTEAGRLLSALKGLFKERGLGYSELAERLEVSLPTMKRLLNKSNLPLDRMLELCRIAGVELSEVISRAEAQRPRHALFTEEQDRLFAERPEFMGFFLRLVEEGKTPLEIERQAGISRLSTERYLIGLERVGLLERLEGLRCKALVRPPFGFGPGSRVLRQQQKRFMERVTASVVEGQSGSFALMKPLSLSPGLAQEMRTELVELLDRYAFFSARAESRGAGHDWNLAVALAPAGDPDQLPAIVELERL
ncbi:helix-turn-helix transcriptional regulator [Pelagicoccus sp. SDUM812003]|uniref:helix-turn-helix domain-containing protein n=1 Tax=Pelagicoccus sp. SDUM812003 TaxID=3041267 RepID=UPI00280C5899|nr:helix-turn-helix transcriptional regulator [Pelagicoccus sp. SDUM812003]MDQ8202262.1 helix-turn-helix transcriptional regulator [Pelagicoccus sp. SDUM812003]